MGIVINIEDPNLVRVLSRSSIGSMVCAIAIDCYGLCMMVSIGKWGLILCMTISVSKWGLVLCMVVSIGKRRCILEIFVHVFGFKAVE